MPDIQDMPEKVTGPTGEPTLDMKTWADELRQILAAIETAQEAALAQAAVFEAAIEDHETRLTDGGF